MHLEIHEAETKLSHLIERAQSGEEIIIAQQGYPVAQLIPITKELKEPRKFGLLQGQIYMSPDFDEPLGDNFPEPWNGK